MTHQELLAKLEQVKNQKSNTITNGDKIYISEYSGFDFMIAKYKIDDYCNAKGITYTLSEQEFANAIIIDIDDLTRSFLLQFYIPVPGEPLPMPPSDVTSYPPYREMVRALNLNQKIINLSSLIDEVHTDLTALDEDMYNSLVDMFSSKDPESHKLATEIITNLNRNDETTLSYALKLYQEFYHQLIISGNPATYEFLTAIEKYREKKDHETARFKDNKKHIHPPRTITNMNGTQILTWIMNEAREQQKKEQNGVRS